MHLSRYSASMLVDGFSLDLNDCSLPSIDGKITVEIVPRPIPLTPHRLLFHKSSFQDGRMVLFEIQEIGFESQLFPFLAYDNLNQMEVLLLSVSSAAYEKIDVILSSFSDIHMRNLNCVVLLCNFCCAT